jgi:hypothetical protein
MKPEQLEYLDTRLLEKVGYLKIALTRGGQKPGFFRKIFRSNPQIK